MLVHLSIRDIVLIERLDIDFRSGLSVLTGETGAGKSILLDSLSLALGARGDAALVRQGANQGQVTAVFDVPGNHPARTILSENEIDQDGDIVLRRIQTSDGRTRVFINDQPASVSLMRDVGHALVEIHGQHDERAMVDVNSHRDLLDAFGGHGDAVNAVRTAWKVWRDRLRALQEHRAHVETAAREADYLRAAVAELSELDPQPGEETELAEQRSSMMKAEKTASEINEASELLSGSASPVPTLSSLVRRLERKSQEVPGLLEEIIVALDESLGALDRAQSGIDDAIRASNFDPHELERAEERLFALRGAARKFSVAVENLPKLRDDMVADLADLDAGEERLATLEAENAELQLAFGRAAERLSEARQAAAGGLEKSVMAELPDLKLEQARFIVAVSSDPEAKSPAGIDQVGFRVQTNPGTRDGPMMKVASGGELSRFLLALKVALTDRGSAPTLVFDEIDTGAGGAVADAIGKRLSRLAEKVQVLSVTHAPQVAARAANHYLISKSPSGKDRVLTGVSAIDTSERREEIARMLAGASITDEARAAAARLLGETVGAETCFPPPV